MLEFIKFRSIIRLPVLIERVKKISEYNKKPLPVIEFKGTVKLHGENIGILFDKKTGEIAIQTRKKIINEDNGNGVYLWFEENKKAIKSLFFTGCVHFKCEQIVVYGEWVGKGIKKGVGVSELSKRFIPFSVLAITGDKQIFETPINDRLFTCIDYFYEYYLKIDFNNLDGVADEIKGVVLSIEEECPVANHYGIKGKGEGIVWKGGYDEGKKRPFMFKSTGDRKYN